MTFYVHMAFVEYYARGDDRSSLVRKAELDAVAGHRPDVAQLLGVKGRRH